MTNPTPTVGTPHRLIWLHLLWSVPLAAFPAGFLIFGAIFNWCGIGACSAPAGAGSRSLFTSLFFFALAGLILAAPFAIVPWTKRVKVRMAVAAAVGLTIVLGGVLFVAFTA